MKTYKILLIDDDPEIVNALCIILESHSYNVISADNKVEGMKKIKTEKPDLIILDVMMDTLSDGFEMAQDLRKIDEFKNLPIILLTGIDSKTGVNFKSAFGNTEMIPVDIYLEKPIEPTKLLKKISELLSLQH